MNQTEFTVARFENRNGTTSWRVSGWLHGLRIRRNFKTREEAAAEKSALEIKALQAASGLRSVATALTEEQIREAEALFQRIAGKAHPLTFYVDFALANYREAETRKPLAEAITEYTAARKREFEQDQISGVQFERIERDLKHLGNYFPGVTVAELTAPKLTAFLERGNPALKTYNNRRGIVSTFLKFCLYRGWIVETLLAKIPARRIRRRRGGAATLTAAQASEFMRRMEDFEGGRWVRFFVLCLFAGIRPSVPDGEIARLKASDVCLKTGVISISAQVSKVREPRKVTIQPNLAAWLQAYPLDKAPLIVPDFHRRRTAIAKEFSLTHDVLRHTFISMFVAKFRSVGEAALQAGNSESIIRKHYLDLKTPEEAEQFFNILPKRAAGSPAIAATPTPTPVEACEATSPAPVELRLAS
ncbi:MAG: site-specific integrase [Opitutae bacterium]|nr:site-specific integrase [Opitutae bacterium]